MNYWAIWCAGRLLTVALGADFADACRNYAAENKVWGRHFDPSRLTWDGRRLFDQFTYTRPAGA